MLADTPRWTKKAALILNIQRFVEHSKSAINSAAFSVQREAPRPLLGRNEAEE
jgi:hypothetical protein